MVIKIKKLVEDAIIPTQGSKEAAGYDLYSIETKELQPMERYAYKTGLIMEIPPVVYGRIAPKSGKAVRNGIDVLAGVIDPDYRGEVCAVLINLSNQPVTIIKGERMAQIVFEYFASASFTEVSALKTTQRNTGGFGSTDVKKTLQDGDLGVSLDDVNKDLVDNKELPLHE